ncbi:rho GTPase-activating protein SYDE2 [Silurus asotus]|uniref:Rho GTPase-activating protein SYDE2 n=1 Tax=Silurus asotus TaxID=30991 RepID=A0AAD5FA43_SILAS|nr:rho GTPase-activating protein SYDE2 [Silurus asotus]
MADPLRRTLLAKLRGKKAKKGSIPADWGNEEEGKGKVFRAPDAHGERAPADTAELRDRAQNAMRGKQGRVYGGFERAGACQADQNEPRAYAHAGRGVARIVGSGGQDARTTPGVSGHKHELLPTNVAGKQAVAVPRRHNEGDSIGFGNCPEVPFILTTENVRHAHCREPASRPGMTKEKHLEVEECLAEPGGTKMERSHSPNLFQYIHSGHVNEHDLIRVIESSLELGEDLSMPSLQSPTFFPTELEIVDADMAPHLVCARESMNRHNSIDSEDDDYYDNEILPFYESGSLSKESNDIEGPSRTLQSEQIVDSSAQETDRLRTQLKEAYYLLINAMDGIAFDAQVQTNGCVEQRNSSSQSPDSLSMSSDSSTRELSRSSEEHDVHQWTLLSSGECTAADRRSSQRSKSLQNLLQAQVRPVFQRSLSDGEVQYPVRANQGDSCSEKRSAPQNTSVNTPPLANQGNLDLDTAMVPEQADEENSAYISHQDSSDGVPLRPSDPLCLQQMNLSRHAGTSVGKPPRVTVNKMQEWMHKGRLLSSEMRQRIAGSSSHGAAQERHGNELQSSSKTFSQDNNMNGEKTGMVNASSGQHSENRDNCTRPVPLNSITVSKKRNWLNQSSMRPSPPSDEDDHTNPSQSHTHTQTCSRPRVPVSDPVEENDADDEGEIWYNPIPEDEEDLHHGEYRERVSRKISGEEGGRVATSARASGNLNASHSSEQKHVYREKCRSQEEKPTIKTTEFPEQSVSGFSPPSSPNPAKKSCSINWSLPERIKSPRTVRKLSIKMKKLPELSKKLSAKGQTIGQTETRTHLPRANGPADLGSGGLSTASTSGNVIWRYHLDSSVCTQQQKKSSGLAAPKSAIKGGYLSDGDSPELVAKSAKHGSSSKSHQKAQEKDSFLSSGVSKLADVASFRPYSLPEQAKCTSSSAAAAAPVSGLLSVHLCGAEGLKTPRSDESRHIYCAIQVDETKRARTALLPCHADFLAMDHTFQLELEEAQRLRLVLFGCEATTAPRRQRVCCHGAVSLAPLFRTANAGRAHRLAVRLEPRGVIYVKLGLTERRQSLTEGNESEKERQREVFGVDAARVVEREATGLMVPLIIEKSIGEIERRGCQVVGLYRLCGSAAVKKELREAFERDSHAVELSENNYPDINVITGVLKDYLRELPHPLISKPLYEAVLDAMSKRPLLMGSGSCENDPLDSDHAAGLLETLPEIEKTTLRKLLDHLKRVASYHEVNKMTCQNLAVCFGPVLLSQRQDASGLANRVFMDSEELASALHFKKHIEVLHYLLQLWPVADVHSKPSTTAVDPTKPLAPVRRRKERPQVLNLSDAELAGVLRSRPGRLDSPSNRYAGDWSDCKKTYLHQMHTEEEEEADYADVPSEEEKDKERVNEEKETLESGNDVKIEENEQKSDVQEELFVEERQENEETSLLKSYGRMLVEQEEHRAKEHTYQAFMKIQEISPVLSNRVNLRDLQESIDVLIGNLERELNKNKLNVGY